MKKLNNYIQEGLLTKKISTKTPKRYSPKGLIELRELITDLLEKGQTNLNCIDLKYINTIKYLFSSVNRSVSVGDIDISEWDVSNIKNMSYAFIGCEDFNCDLSNWNVSNVEDMDFMFYQCKTLAKNNNIPTWYKGKV